MATSHVPTRKRIGDILLDAGLIDSAQLQAALTTARASGDKLGRVLVQSGQVSQAELVAALAYQLNLPAIGLKDRTPQPEALALVPAETARRLALLPLSVDATTIVIVMADPLDLTAIEDIQRRTGRRVTALIATEDDVRRALDLHYSSQAEIARIASRAEVATPIRLTPVAGLTVEDSPVVQALDLIISQAVRARASDIHLEPQPDRLRVRYRVDGVLRDANALPLTIGPALISRVKVLADMNIAERRRPQDGQFSLSVAGRAVDIRAATIETRGGEKLVLRLLAKDGAALDLDALGFSAPVLARYRALLRSAYGMILIAGPTGSGKTTTLYASINTLDRGADNIMTIEDPVEYAFADTNQIEVNPGANMSFATGLRALMRLDPDIILIGEIRDAETASAAVNAALTGHLVLSSIHANDAVSTLLRLTNFGLDPFLVASSLLGVMAQRLVRRVCGHCAAQHQVTDEEATILASLAGDSPIQTSTSGAGCAFCGQTGYLGRLAVAELMTVTDDLRDRFLARASLSALRQAALAGGMVPLLDDGLVKVRQGITTPAEVMRRVFTLA